MEGSLVRAVLPKGPRGATRIQSYTKIASLK